MFPVEPGSPCAASTSLLASTARADWGRAPSMAKRRKPAAKAADELTALVLETTGLAPGCRAQSNDETNQDFFDRILAEFPEVISACEGSIELAAVIFDIDDGALKDIANINPAFKSQWQKAAGLMLQREKRDEEVTLMLKEEMVRQANPDKYKYQRKKVWPKDPKARRRQIIKALTDLGAMDDYNGSTIQMAKPMKLTPEELDAVIQSDPELVRWQRICQSGDDAAAERNLILQAATGNSPTAAMKVLTNRHPDKYSDKQQIDVKNTGFAPPSKDDVPENVLFKKKEEKCDEES